MFARIVSNIVPAVTSRLYRGFVSFRNFWIAENAKAPEPGILNIAQDITAHLSSNKAPEPGVLNVAQDITARLSSAQDMGVRQLNKAREHVSSDTRTIMRIAQMLNMRFSGDFMRVIFGSLAYSLLIFFVGFTIVQIIVFAG
jgi:hypothetical protein